MAYEYSLPVLASATPVTNAYTSTGALNSTAVIATGSLTLSSTQTYTTGFSAVGTAVLGRFDYTIGGTAQSGLSATTTSLILTLSNNIGNIKVFGYISASTLVPSTSTYTSTIKFNSHNFQATTLYLTGFQTGTRFLTGGGVDSRIDNILTKLALTPGYSVTNGLTSINSNGYRTVSRQARLVQGEY